MLANLKKLREEHGISQRLLAETIGVSQQSINKYENHNIEPDIAILIQIANFFNTFVDYLIGHTKIRHKIEPVRSYDLNNEEEKLLNEYRQLNQKQKQVVNLIIQTYNES